SQQWSGPIDSAYGKHWVFVESHKDPADPELNEVLPRVKAEFLREREQEALRNHVEGLRAQAEINVEADQNARASSAGLGD
ncbi:hypothetical protein MK280_10470, partial [Myxococcota bacterium]|nr:hypothetical protein [Myxococcota bacterium]